MIEIIAPTCTFLRQLQAKISSTLPLIAVWTKFECVRGVYLHVLRDNSLVNDRGHKNLKQNECDGHFKVFKKLKTVPGGKVRVTALSLRLISRMATGEF